ncbi:MAG: caspase family protein [Archangiaceae bacterium]|nr:caspase family protein [Archangiaceae bacterium]
MTGALLATAALLAAAPDPELYAIIVGYNGGGPNLPTLRFADDDALRFHRWFEGLTPRDHLWLLADPDEATRAAAHGELPLSRPPTRAALLAALDELKARLRGRHARVFFIYAGHGLPGRFLLQPESGEEAAFTGRELRTAFSGIEAETAVLFLDACRSQSLFAERGANDFTQEVRALERAADASPLGILTAASSTQSAGEATSLGGGYFSHVLASGLAGAADADADGTVRFGELAAFVAFHTERLFGQRPWFEAPGGDLRAPVLELAARTGLTLDPGLEGRLRVRALPGLALVAELNKPRGLPAQLALPPGAYRVERGSDAAEVEVTAHGKVQVEPAAFIASQVAARGGDDALDGFQTAFSTDVVNALSAGYDSGVQTAQAAAWSHALDVVYGVDPAPFGLRAVEHGAELGYRLGLGRFFIGARALFHSAAFADVSLNRAGALADLGLRFLLGPLELQPHAGAGLMAVWRIQGAITHADFTVPLVTAGLRLEVPIGLGLSVTADARAEVSFVSLDGVRTPFVSPLLALGVSWKR